MILHFEVVGVFRGHRGRVRVISGTECLDCLTTAKRDKKTSRRPLAHTHPPACDSIRGLNACCNGNNTKGRVHPRPGVHGHSQQGDSSKEIAFRVFVAVFRVDISVRRRPATDGVGDSCEKYYSSFVNPVKNAGKCISIQTKFYLPRNRQTICSKFKVESVSTPTPVATTDK